MTRRQMDKVIAALRRELREEVGYVPECVNEFTALARALLAKVTS